jgi:hypothetical protein
VGGADLVWRDGISYLHVTQGRQAPSETVPEGGALGVDLGIVNLATDSEGAHFTGKLVSLIRKRYHLRRQRLQKVNTKSAKRRLRQMRRRESRVSKATRTTASANNSSTKPPHRARQSLVRTCVASMSEQRFDANIATSGIPGHSSNCGRLSPTKRRGLACRSIW